MRHGAAAPVCFSVLVPILGPMPAPVPASASAGVMAALSPWEGAPCKVASPRQHATRKSCCCCRCRCLLPLIHTGAFPSPSFRSVCLSLSLALSLLLSHLLILFLTMSTHHSVTQSQAQHCENGYCSSSLALSLSLSLAPSICQHSALHSSRIHTAYKLYALDVHSDLISLFLFHIFPMIINKLAQMHFKSGFTFLFYHPLHFSFK